MKIETKKDAKDFLDYLNKEYFKLLNNYEKYFWTSYMGDHSVDVKFAKAKEVLNKFRSNRALSVDVERAIKIADNNTKDRLKYWEKFFSLWQIPEDLIPLMGEISKLEYKIKDKQSNYDYGYTDPKTRKFVKASRIKLSLNVATDQDEGVRKACYESIQDNSLLWVDDYIEYANLLNRFAKALGFKDFYDYKINIEEGMSKKELFDIFDSIFDKTKKAFPDIKKLAKEKKGMEKPWNFSFMTSADFTKEEDQYFQFENALPFWLKSFANLGVDFKGSKIKLDLLDRKGKYDNGFCHWPEVIRFDGAKRIPGQANFTCNLVPGAIGSGEDGMTTLFHEGGHAAHYLNSEMRDICLNTEYPPASTAWAETQSMFMDTIFSSIEWRNRYAKNDKGEAYPLDLFKRKLEKLYVFSPMRLMGIMKVMNFERRIYETKDLTKEKVLKIAREVNNKFSAFNWDSTGLLNVPHIYSWESACSYHGYGLAELGLSQWREYFFKKYGYIVDNPNIGKEMKRVWSLGSSLSFKEFIKKATGKNISPQPFIRSVMRSKSSTFKLAQERIDRLKKVKNKDTLNVNARIELVHGKKKIADNSRGNEAMIKKYASWLKTQ